MDAAVYAEAKIINRFDEAEWGVTFYPGTGKDWLEAILSYSQIGMLLSQSLSASIPLLRVADVSANQLAFTFDFIAAVIEGIPGVNICVYANDLSYYNPQTAEQTLLNRYTLKKLAESPLRDYITLYSKNFFDLILPQPVDILIDRLGVGCTFSGLKTNFAQAMLDNYFKKANELLHLGGVLVVDAHDDTKYFGGFLPESTLKSFEYFVAKEYESVAADYGFQLTVASPETNDLGRKILGTVGIFTKVSDLGVVSRAKTI